MYPKSQEVSRFDFSHSGLQPGLEAPMAAIDLTAFRERTVLIFGGSGFLGSHIKSALSEIGALVVSASRSCETARMGHNVIQRRCDASDREQVDGIFHEVQPDIVYHLTSDSRGGQDMSLIPDSIQNDILATTNVLTA